MCGIGGVLRVHPPGSPPPPPPSPPSLDETIPEAWLDVLDRAVAHRGPDGAGRFRDRATRPDGSVVDVALVHRRLAIIDLADGHQPMISEPAAPADGAPASDLLALVFNGCIYNHRALRSELAALGYAFRTDHSDTEVLLHAWRAWGPEMLGRLDGMFAALLWDRARGELIALRDRCGEKPLYFSPLEERFDGFGDPDLFILHRDARAFGFSSSFAGLLALRREMGLRTTLSRGEIGEWTAAGWRDIATPVYEVDEFWKGTLAVFPARAGAPRPACVGDEPYVPAVGHTAHQPFRSAFETPRAGELTPERVDELLAASVAERLGADVPIGCFLSGGIDSGLIAAHAVRLAGRFRTFCVRMPDPRYDESEAAAATARHLGAEHITLECDARPAEDLVRLIEGLGLPFGDSSLLPTYWVSRAAREHVKVALAGDGGDELFGGYQRHAAAPLLARLIGWPLPPIDRLLPDRDPKSRASKLRRLLHAAREGRRHRRRVRDEALPGLSETYHDVLAIFNRTDAVATGICAVPSVFFESISPPTAAALAIDFERYLPADLLRKTDTASMACALEVRCPFLDRELIDAALSARIESLMPGGERKGLLKRVARRYLPAEIVDRPKMGFAIPVGEWFRTDFGGMRQLLHDHLLSNDPFPGLGPDGEIDLGAVRRMLAEHDAAGERSLHPWRGRDHGQRLYVLLVLSIWCRWVHRERLAAMPEEPPFDDDGAPPHHPPPPPPHRS